MPWLSSSFIQSLNLIVTVGAIIFGVYWGLHHDTETQQVAMAGFEARLSASEHATAAMSDRADRFAAEMRAAYTEIAKGVADLRVQEAARRK